MVTIAPTCNSEYKVILTRRQTENILYFIFIPCFTAGIGTSDMRRFPLLAPRADTSPWRNELYKS